MRAIEQNFEVMTLNDAIRHVTEGYYAKDVAESVGIHKQYLSDLKRDVKKIGIADKGEETARRIAETCGYELVIQKRYFLRKKRVIQKLEQD